VKSTQSETGNWRLWARIGVEDTNRADGPA